jgi:hypothetical protein
VDVIAAATTAGVLQTVSFRAPAESVQFCSRKRAQDLVEMDHDRTRQAGNQEAIDYLMLTKCVTIEKL